MLLPIELLLYTNPRCTINNDVTVVILQHATIPEAFSYGSLVFLPSSLYVTLALQGLRNLQRGI